MRIRGLGASGDGVATLPDGRAIFVPRTAPGDSARVAVEVNRPRWARGRLLEVVEPSADRRTPPCARYDECGGCQLQHLSYDAQLEAKATRVRDALTRIGGLEVALDGILPSPHEFGYRSRVRFHLARDGAGAVSAGFHKQAQPGSIADISSECLVIDEPLKRAWSALRAAWGVEAHLLPRGPSLELLLRSLKGGVALTVIGGSSWKDGEALLEAVPEISGLWWTPQGSTEVRWVAGAKTLTEEWNSEELSLGASGFLQANREGATTLWNQLCREVGSPGGKTIVDAYSGVGVYGRLLARHGAVVTGIELDPYAAESSLEGAPDGFQVKVGRVEKILPSVLPVDCVITNPPRQGMHEDAVKALCARPPEQLIYVSCDPATLARDLSRMSDVFRVTRLQSVDLFPQTAHVETLVTAVRIPQKDAGS